MAAVLDRFLMAASAGCCLLLSALLVLYGWDTFSFILAVLNGLASYTVYRLYVRAARP